MNFLYIKIKADDLKYNNIININFELFPEKISISSFYNTLKIYNSFFYLYYYGFNNIYINIKLYKKFLLFSGYFTFLPATGIFAGPSSIVSFSSETSIPVLMLNIPRTVTSSSEQYIGSAFIIKKRNFKFGGYISHYKNGSYGLAFLANFDKLVFIYSFSFFNGIFNIGNYPFNFKYKSIFGLSIKNSIYYFLVEFSIVTYLNSFSDIIYGVWVYYLNFFGFLKIPNFKFIVYKNSEHKNYYRYLSDFNFYEIVFYNNFSNSYFKIIELDDSNYTFKTGFTFNLLKLLGLNSKYLFLNITSLSSNIILNFKDNQYYFLNTFNFNIEKILFFSFYFKLINADSSLNNFKLIKKITISTKKFILLDHLFIYWTFYINEEESKTGITTYLLYKIQGSSLNLKIDIYENDNNFKYLFYLTINIYF